MLRSRIPSSLSLTLEPDVVAIVRAGFSEAGRDALLE